MFRANVYKMYMAVSTNLGVPFVGGLVIRALLFWDSREGPIELELRSTWSLDCWSIWVVVKLMVPFRVRIIIRDLVFRGLKRGPWF